MAVEDLDLGAFDDFETFNEDVKRADCACPKCLPKWIMTFADLMSLMLCFFVLLYSFAELNVIKYQQLALAIPGGFGVDTDEHVVKLGTSVIQRQFSPMLSQDVSEQLVQEAPPEELQFLKLSAPKHTQMARPMMLLYALLAEEVAAGTVSIERVERKIIVSIDEKASFQPGKADFNSKFDPLLRRLALVVGALGQTIVIAGHTDNIPISTRRYRSNWELSTARAVSVYHGLKKYTKIAKDRLMIAGYADSKPVEANDSAAHRAKNRRVEIQFLFGAPNAK